ncbi:Pup--protein ligase [Brevibacterium gallinarum]|uniref:Pup--protein ligase n=1 Tax=Brevibacterium gallinarum TaxID=2762220 RepID=A0ABR8WUS1_9MICO|nr:Pup--protein ligase [Brevibacterium gallinarum]MBD8020813.1 Pup--protein ligase [Brevibacterium gallinarum]
MKRIFGLETEYGLAYTQGESRRVGPEEIARYLFRPVVEWGRSSNVFLPNGARLYLDVGSHPEYATAECDRLPDLLAQDAAGDQIMVELLEQAQQALTADGIDGRAHLVKNNVDSAGNSYGSHENFLIRRSMDFSHLTTVLLPFLVTRQLLVGAGAIIPAKVTTELKPADSNRANPHAPARTPQLDPGLLQFGLSARSDVMWEGVSSATTRSRPIINARDEPHADAEKYRRLHVIVGDSSMSQTTTELKVGSAALVLDLIETGVPIEDLSLRNPIRDIRRVARDLTGRTELELASGRTMTALELLGIYLRRAQKLVAKGDHSLGDDATAARVIDRWQRMLTAVDTGDFAPVAAEIDWVIKRRLFDRYIARGDIELSDPRIARLDFAYHDLTPQTSIFKQFEAKGAAARAVTAEAVEQARRRPPSTTRAHLRGQFVAAAQGAGKDYTVDWVHLRLNDQLQRAIVLKDPFSAAHEQAEKLIAGLDGEPAAFDV